MLALLDGSSSDFALSQFLLFAELNAIMLKIPRAEWSGINVNDGVLDESLGPDKLVVRGVIDYSDDSCLFGEGFRAPGIVPVIKAESSVLDITSTASNDERSLGSELCHGRLATHFVHSLLLVNWHPTSSGASLVTTIPRNPHS